MSTVMNTFSGVPIDVAAPHWNQIRLSDIAIALSRINRFLGHTDGGDRAPMRSWGGVWSVAQHSLYVRDLVEHCLVEGPLPVARAYAILHDGNEMVGGDIISPVKAAMRARGFDFDAAIADPIQRAIHEAFVLPPAPDARVAAAVAAADRRAGEIEKRAFLDGVVPREAWLQPRAGLRMAPPELVAEMFEEQANADLHAATQYVAGAIAAETSLRLEAEAARNAGACGGDVPGGDVPGGDVRDGSGFGVLPGQLLSGR